MGVLGFRVRVMGLELEFGLAIRFCGWVKKGDDM